MIKIGVAYTGLNPTVMDVTESSLKDALGDRKYQLITYSRPDAVAEVQSAGVLTAAAAQWMAKSYFSAMEGGVDIIYNVCSTVGDAAALMQPVFEKFGVPIVRCDEEMMRQAVRKYQRIALIATSASTMIPCVNLIHKCMEEEKVSPEITQITLDEAFKKPLSVLQEAAIRTVKPDADKYDCVLLTQSSWRALGEPLTEALGIPVLSASAFGPQELVRRLDAMGK